MDMPSADVAVSRDEIDAQLALLFEHRLFKTSPALKRFLEYVVAEELEGRGPEVKAYSIAISALERPDSFDPQTDPIVRVTGSKLRGNLELYYATDGQSDPVRIEIPKGTYRPVISPQSVEVAPREPRFSMSGLDKHTKYRIWIAVLAVLLALVTAGCIAGLLGYFDEPQPGPVAALPEAAQEEQLPVLEVLPFSTALNREGALFANGLRHQLIIDLAQFRSIRVRELVASLDAAIQQRQAALPPATYRLSGAVQTTEQDSRLGLTLTKVPSSTVMWSRNVRFPSNDYVFHTTLLQTINAIAAEIASETGVVHMDALNRLRVRTELLGNPRTSEYECLLLSYAYDNTKSGEDEAEARACLQERTASGSKSSSLWSAWALMQMLDWSRQKGEDGDLLQQALSAARRAVALDPANSVAYEVQGSVLSTLGNREEALASYERGLDLNPSNPSLYFHVGWQHVLAGDWEGGLPLIRRAIDMSPSPPPYMRIALSMEAFHRTDYDTALSEAQAVLQTGDQRGAALAYAAAVGLQDRDLIRQYAATLRQSEGFDPSDPMKEVRRSFSEPPVMEEYDNVLRQSPISW